MIWSDSMSCSTATLALFFPLKRLRKICHLAIRNGVTESLGFLYMCIKVKIVKIKLHVKERTVNKDIKALKNGLDMLDSNIKKLLCK